MRGEGDPQGAALATARRRDLRGRAVGALDDVARVREEQLAGGGQVDLPRGAAEELGAELRLQ
jgi:hypothetical protein